MRTLQISLTTSAVLAMAMGLSLGCSSSTNNPMPGNEADSPTAGTTTASTTTSGGSTTTGGMSSATTAAASTTTSATTNASSVSTTSSSTTTGGGGGSSLTTSGSTGAGTGGSTGAGGASSTGTAGSGGAGSTTGGSGALGDAVQEGSGTTDERFETIMVTRHDVPYVMITNGWGPGFGSHTISWEGTSFVVEDMTGTRGSNYQPASYPTVFCGSYSVQEVPDCGLPAEIASLTSIRTGWRWAPGSNAGEYNAAYDIWVSNGGRLQGYLMVWLRDPPQNQPAGQPNMNHQRVTVENVPGVWNIWDGMVNNLPIINWVREEGNDSYEIEFDVLDFVRDAETRGLLVPGNTINAVAVGFEIWEGPVQGLISEDFYVHVE